MQIEVEPRASWNGKIIDEMDKDELFAVVMEMHKALVKSAEVSMRALETIKELKANKPLIASVN